MKWRIGSYDKYGNKKYRYAWAHKYCTECDKAAQLETKTNEILAYPNPVTRFITIQLNSPTVGDFVTAIDLNGRQFQLELIPLREDLIQVDFSNLTTGLYLLRVKTENEVNVIRVIKK